MMGVGVGWVTQVIECFDFRLWVPMRAAVAGGTVMLAAQRFSGVFPHSLPPPSLAPPGERGGQPRYGSQEKADERLEQLVLWR